MLHQPVRAGVWRGWGLPEEWGTGCHPAAINLINLQCLWRLWGLWRARKAPLGWQPPGGAWGNPTGGAPKLRALLRTPRSTVLRLSQLYGEGPPFLVASVSRDTVFSSQQLCWRSRSLAILCPVGRTWERMALFWEGVSRALLSWHTHVTKPCWGPIPAS